MAEVPYPDDSERLFDNIRTELKAQAAIEGLHLDSATLDDLASGVAASVAYAFEVRWAPGWVEPGDPHRWVEGSDTGGEEHFVECLQCRRVTSHETADDADRWWASHQDHHP